MRFFHLSDLHFGKNVNGYSMLPDQAHWLEELLREADRVRPDAVLIAGDLYDRAAPREEAVALCDRLLTGFARREIPVLAISGNHDSGTRLSFARELMEKSRVYLSGTLRLTLDHCTLEDTYGPVDFWLLPFCRPGEVEQLLRQAGETGPFSSFTQLMQALLQRQPVDPSRRNVLLAHQFVVHGAWNPLVTDSECHVGALEGVDCSAFAGFDYVALGHLHRPQQVGRPEVRYGGTPMKYSFSELNYANGILDVTLGRKGELDWELLPTTPLHPLRAYRGTMEELLQSEDREGYVRITLTDELEPENAQARLEQRYPHLMELRFDNSRTCGGGLEEAAGAASLERQDGQDLFRSFFEQQNGREMDETELALLQKVLRAVGGAG